MEGRNNYHLLELSVIPEDFSVGKIYPFEVLEERYYPKTPVFLMDNKDNIFGVGEVLDYSFLNNRTIGNYRILKILSERDASELISLLKYPERSIVLDTL